MCAYTAPALLPQGETAAPSYKPAVLTNGVKLMVPPFIQRGDHVVVDTQEGTFVRRGSGGE